jgi:DHA2 family multidrug resistance protein
MFVNRPKGPLDPDTQAILDSMVKHASFVQAMNDAWLLVSVLTCAAIFCVPFARVQKNMTPKGLRDGSA